jgi:hypothetical protein
MRGMSSNLEVEMVLMLGMVKMVMKIILPMPRRSRWRRFPTGSSSRTAGSALLEVEEGFRLRLRKFKENMVYIFYKTNMVIKIWSRGDARRPNGPRWRSLVCGSRHHVLFGPRGSPCVILVLQLLLVIKY